MYLSSLASATAFRLASKAYTEITSSSCSVGHICWDGDTEWYQCNGWVCRATRSDVIDLSTGCRIGRAEAKVSEVASYPKCFAYLGEQFVDLCLEGKGHRVGV